VAKQRFNMVSESSSTTGTGNITVTGAKTPGQTFATAGVAVSDTFKYRAQHDTLNEWEIGLGTMLSSTTFSRSVIASSNANALVSFSSGGLTIELVIDAEDSFKSKLLTAEANLGSRPMRSGRFTIAGSGMTVGKPVLIQQAVGPYTGKGTLADECEDMVVVTASVTSPTVITAYWRAVATPLRGNVKFNYMVSE